MSERPVVILTAMNLEYEAVRERLTDLTPRRHPAGTRFEVGRLGGTGCQVVLGLVGKGNHPAAVLAERAMAQFSPAAVLFVGVAGALWPNIQHGDGCPANRPTWRWPPGWSATAESSSTRPCGTTGSGSAR